MHRPIIYNFIIETLISSYLLCLLICYIDSRFFFHILMFASENLLFFFSFLLCSIRKVTFLANSKRLQWFNVHERQCGYRYRCGNCEVNDKNVIDSFFLISLCWGHILDGNATVFRRLMTNTYKKNSQWFLIFLCYL